MKHSERPMDMLLRQMKANRDSIRYRNKQTGQRHFCHEKHFVQHLFPTHLRYAVRFGRRRMKPLTVEDFKMDYKHLVIRFEHPHERRVAALILIQQHYHHVERACIDYLKSL